MGNTLHTLVAAFGIVSLVLSGQGLAQTVSDKQVLADFKDGLGIFSQSKGTAVESKDLGSRAMSLKKDQGIMALSPKVDWTKFNFMRFEAFNAAGQPARLQIMFDDGDAPHGYYSWINRYISIRPGKSTVELYLSELRRGEGSPKDSTDPRPFNWKNIVRLGITTLSGEVELANIRLEKVQFPIAQGVWAFKFGPAGAPVTPGTVGVTPETAYTDAAGYGWSKKGAIWARRRPRPADTFVGSWISGDGATFSVKVPDGKYHVWMIWEDPGEWELYQNYTHRSISAGGKVVLEEKMDGKEFLDRYFHFAEQEDLPGDDIYKTYVQWRYQPREFDVEAKGGRLDLTINGSSQYAATVNGMIIFPAERAKEGQAAIASLQEWRKHEFLNTWTEQKPTREPVPVADAKEAERGFLVWRRSRDRNVGIYDAPAEKELVRAGGLPAELNVTACRGQRTCVNFSVTALKDLANAKIETSEIRAEEGRSLPAGSVTVQMTRYKFKCIGFGAAGVYGSVPWLLVDAKPGPLAKECSRTYWLNVSVPADQAAGTYKGKLTLDADGKPFVFDVSIRVLPLTLPDADMGLGMFIGWGDTAPCFAYFPENQARNDADRERSLAYAREQGLTYVSIGGVRFAEYKDGKARFDFSQARKQYQLVRKVGFPFIDLVIDGAIYESALKDKGEMAKKNGFASSDEMVKELFGAAIRGAKEAGLPEPVWSLGDEPPDTVAPVFIEMYKRMKDLAGARSRICWSPHGENTKKLLDVTSICDLNGAKAEDFDRARKAGNTLFLNNQGRNRWAFGLYMWKAHQAGVQGYQQFTWVGTHADPYYPLDSNEDDGGHIYPDREGNIRPVVDLVRIREGVTDYRCTLALSRAIEKVKALADKADASQVKAAQDARAYLKSVLEPLKFEDTSRDRRPQMTEAQLDEYRAKVLEFLTKLEGA
ncbi:MAG: hypothetical protein ACE15C_19885 [Phycisphaerae bacterium]